MSFSPQGNTLASEASADDGVSMWQVANDLNLEFEQLYDVGV